MNTQDLVQRHGFRPGTREDFMVFAGAEPDAVFRYKQFELDPDSSCIGIYSESTGTYHFYVSVGDDHSLQIGKQVDGVPVLAWTCAAAFDEWARIVADSVGDPLLRAAGLETKTELIRLGFEEL